MSEIEGYVEMLTRWIVDLYAWLIEIALWIFVLIAAVGGFFGTVPMLSNAGWVIENDGAWSFAGAICLAAFAFLLAAVFVGPVVILVDIRKSLRALEKRGNAPGISGEVRRSASPNPFSEHDVQFP